MTILALDLGTQCGFAISDKDERTVFSSGTNSFHPSRFDSSGVRYIKFQRWLNDASEECGPFERIVYESVVRHAGTTAAHVYGGFLATLQTWAERHGIPYEGVLPNVWKSSTCGKGNAAKPYVQKCMEDRGHVPEDENESDALAILYHAMKQ